MNIPLATFCVVIRKPNSIDAMAPKSRIHMLYCFPHSTISLLNTVESINFLRGTSSTFAHRHLPSLSIATSRPHTKGAICCRSLIHIGFSWTYANSSSLRNLSSTRIFLARNSSHNLYPSSLSVSDIGHTVRPFGCVPWEDIRTVGAFDSVDGGVYNFVRVA